MAVLTLTHQNAIIVVADGLGPLAVSATLLVVRCTLLIVVHDAL